MVEFYAPLPAPVHMIGAFLFSGAGREGSPLTMSQRDGWLVNGSA